MDKKVYLYHGKVERVVDGDTVDMTVDYGFNHFEKHIRLRVVGPDGGWFDAYEINKGTREEKLAGKAGRDLLRELLPPHTDVVIRTFRPDAKDSFGRWLAAIWVPGKDQDVATELVLRGLGFFDRRATAK